MAFKSTIISVFVNELKKIFFSERRTSRRQYWLSWFVWFHILYLTLLGPVIYKNFSPIGFIIVGLVAAVSLFSLSVRRLQDINKSGLLILLVNVPIIGIILKIYLFSLQGCKVDNKYGPPPMNYKLTLLDKIWLGIFSIWILVSILLRIMGLLA